jgi:hypothetical protein
MRKTSPLLRGFWLLDAPEPGPITHRFCGQPRVEGAECPNCARPLLQYAALDTRDRCLAPLEWLTATLPLLYCWRCNVAQGEFAYRVGRDRIALLRWEAGGVALDFPYADYPDSFPEAPARLAAMGRDDQRLIRELNRGLLPWSAFRRSRPELAVPRHQIGGEPFLIQARTRAQDCPICRRPLRLLAAFGDKATDPRGFVGNEFTQVVFLACVGCAVIGVQQYCD